MPAFGQRENLNAEISADRVQALTGNEGRDTDLSGISIFSLSSEKKGI